MIGCWIPGVREWRRDLRREETDPRGVRGRDPGKLHRVYDGQWKIYEYC